MSNEENSVKARTREVMDPVCRMEVDPGQRRLLAIFQGRSYWFCSEDCRGAFEMNPRKYLDAKREKRKGWFRRYLERLGKINKEEFGCTGPKCH